MDEIVNPDRPVSVPFGRTRYDADFHINTAINKGIGLVLTENKRFKTDFFSFCFFRKANGYLLLSLRKVELRDGMVLLLSPHQQQGWRVDETALGYTSLIFHEDFMRTLITDKFFVFRLLYCYQTDMPPYTSAIHDKMKEYTRLLGKIECELMNPVSDTYDIIVSLLYYLLLIINRTYAATYCLPAEIARDSFAFRFRDLLERNIRTRQQVQGYAGILHVNRVTLNNSAKTQFGVSATRLIKQHLLGELKNELLFSSRTISEMTDDFNFSDPSHLVHFFKQQTGKTFTQYITGYNKGIYE